MSADLKQVPDLLPPMALPALAPPPTAMRAALVGLGLLAMVGVWRTAPDPLDLVARPALAQAAALPASAPQATPHVLPALLAAPSAEPAYAGQPAALNAAGAADGDPALVPAAAAIGQ